MTMVNNLSKICRVCMEDGVYDILTSIFDDDYSVHISEKIMACAQVKVDYIKINFKLNYKSK